MKEHLPLILFIALPVAIAAAIIAFGRLAAKNPDKAAQLEADFDALLAKAIGSELTPAALDRVLKKVYDADLVALGSASDARLRETAATAEKMAAYLQAVANDLRTRIAAGK